MWDWIVQNKQWVFSGAGVSIIAAVLWFLSKLFRPEPKTPAPTSASNSVVQAPVISVAPVFHSSYPAESPQVTKPDAQIAPTLPARRTPPEEDDPGPKLYSLPPRIVGVSEKDVEEGTGILEGGEALRAVVATFRMKKPSTDGHATYVTARLSYRTTENIIGREISREIHRVNYGTWVEEEFNFVEMTLTDTKELVLVLQATGDAQCVAVQDNRHSTTKYNGLAFHKLEPHADSFFVDVTLVDANYGPVITYTYKIEVDPLKVHEIIRVPRF
jgi:hypothetical protein